jgi:hypothetical protein
MIERECDLLGAPVRTGRAGGAHRAGAIDAADRPAGKDVPGVPTYATVPGRPQPINLAGRHASMAPGRRRPLRHRIGVNCTAPSQDSGMHPAMMRHPVVGVRPVRWAADATRGRPSIIRRGRRGSSSSS